MGRTRKHDYEGIVAMHKAGCTPSEICKRYFCTPTTITTALNRVTGIDGTERRNIEIKRIITEIEKMEHCTTQEAREKLGVSSYLIHRAFKKFGRPANCIPENPSPGQMRILNLLLKGKKQVDVAKELGLSRERVRQVASRAMEAGLLPSMTQETPCPASE